MHLIDIAKKHMNLPATSQRIRGSLAVGTPKMKIHLRLDRFAINGTDGYMVNDYNATR